MSNSINPPISLPAVEAKTFDEWFYTNFRCENLHNEELATLTFDRVPRNSITKELLHNHTETVQRKFWPLVTPGSPDFDAEAAQAMAAVLSVLPKLSTP
jgi:hypothetical protein